MSSPQVLIVGAGPTGLVLALRLRHHGLACRIIDQNAGPGLASRATVVQARTLEFYQQLGIADAMVAQGIPIRAMQVRAGGREITSIPLGAIGTGTSPFPFVLSFPQDDHEHFLTTQLAAQGVTVEWNTELTHFVQDEFGVSVTLRTPDHRQVQGRFRYLCGCDGVHSRVRTQLALPFPGGTYPQQFFVADVALAGPPSSDLLGTFGGRDFVLMMPVRSSQTQRLVGIIPAALAGRDDLTFANLQATTEQLLGIQVTAVNWFSSYRVSHRVAAHFHVDRTFLLGDAGHVHSPVGGQGMNTGIGDAVNLAWKLATVLQGKAHSRLLDTYEHERIAFARALVSTTDRAFTTLVTPGFRGQVARHWLLPHVLPWLATFQAVQRLIFGTISQVRISYRDSALSQGQAGAIAGGDRLPWLPPVGIRASNYDALRALAWRVHVYGQASAEVLEVTSQLDLPVEVFPWDEGVRQTGLARDALYLVRPDGHVGMALAPGEVGRLRRYLADWGITP